MTDSADDRDECQSYMAIGRYANYFKIGYNAFEVVLEFGEKFSDADGAQMHTRIVTNPIYAQALLGTLNDALHQFDRSAVAAGIAKPPETAAGD
jgi:hypothetical protein